MPQKPKKEIAVAEEVEATVADSDKAARVLAEEVAVEDSIAEVEAAGAVICGEEKEDRIETIEEMQTEEDEEVSEDHIFQPADFLVIPIGEPTS